MCEQLLVLSCWFSPEPAASARSRIRSTSCSKRHPRRLGGLGEEAGVGEAGDRVGLEHPGAVGGEDQVDPGEPGQAQRPVGAERRLDHRGALALAERRRALEAGAADLVAGLEVVAVAFGRDRLDHRQRLVADHADRHLATVDEALEQHLLVVAEGGDEGPRDLRRRRGEADAERGAAAARLDHQREAEAGLERAERVGGAELAEGCLFEAEPVGGGDAGLADRVLGEDLVDAAGAGRGAGAGEGDAEDLQQLLGGAVLAAGAVHRDEGDVGALGLEPPHQVGADVDRQHLVAEPLERVLDPGAGAQRDAALERAAAFEDRDLHAEPPRRTCGTAPRSRRSRLAGGGRPRPGSGCSPVSAP